MTRVVSFLTNILLFLAAISLVLMMLHVTFDVFGKYVFLKPIPGTAEIVANYYMIGVVFLPIAYMEITDQPIVAELLFKLAPDKLKFMLLITAYICSMLFYGLLAWYYLDVAIGAYEIGDYVIAITKVIVWPSKFFLPLGLLVACIALGLKIYRLLRAGPEYVNAPPEREADGGEWTI